jgi:hypothetical protein
MANTVNLSLRRLDWNRPQEKSNADKAVINGNGT